MLRLLTKREGLPALISVIRGDDQWPLFIIHIPEPCPLCGSWIFRLSGREMPYVASIVASTLS